MSMVLAHQLTLDPLEEAEQLIADLMTVLDDRMTKAGHPHQLVTWEHRGVCPPKACSLRCQVYRALFVEASAWLERRAGL